MMKCAPVLYITLLLVALAILLLTFPKELPKPPQERARFTNYTTWHSPWKGWDQQVVDTTTTFGIVVMFLSTVFAFKWTSPSNVASEKNAAYIYDGSRLNSGLLFDRFIAWYILATHISGWAYVFLDLGKLWVAFGLLHNTAELAILLLLHDGGRVRHNRYFFLVAGYTSIVLLGVCHLGWPNDAVFFKTQGLCLDWSLAIAFLRITLETRRRVSNGSVLPHNASDVLPDEDGPSDTYSTANFVDHPKQLWMLVAASTIHIAGNVATTFKPDSGSYFLVFLHSYNFTFPLYAYYVFLDTHAPTVVPQKQIYACRDPAWKTAVLVILSIFLSLLTMRFALVAIS